MQRTIKAQQGKAEKRKSKETGKQKKTEETK
jgi:hypothetical protein